MFNVLICGTPGTGKSTLVHLLQPHLPHFSVIDVSKFAIQHGCIESFDESLQSHVLDQDKLLDALEPVMKSSQHNLIESIHSDQFADATIDLIFVCRTSNDLLFDRLKARGYPDQKIQENVQSEIFQVIYDEAREGFAESKIHEIYNNNVTDLDRNVQLITKLTEESYSSKMDRMKAGSQD